MDTINLTASVAYVGATIVGGIWYGQRSYKAEKARDALVPGVVKRDAEKVARELGQFAVAAIMVVSGGALLIGWIFMLADIMTNSLDRLGVHLVVSIVSFPIVMWSGGVNSVLSDDGAKK